MEARMIGEVGSMEKTLGDGGAGLSEKKRTMEGAGLSVNRVHM